jgi:hypothetical protein
LAKLTVAALASKARIRIVFLNIILTLRSRMTRSSFVLTLPSRDLTREREIYSRMPKLFKTQTIVVAPIERLSFPFFCVM